MYVQLSQIFDTPSPFVHILTKEWRHCNNTCTLLVRSPPHSLAYVLYGCPLVKNTLWNCYRCTSWSNLTKYFAVIWQYQRKIKTFFNEFLNITIYIFNCVLFHVRLFTFSKIISTASWSSHKERFSLNIAVPKFYKYKREIT